MAFFTQLASRCFIFSLALGIHRLSLSFIISLMSLFFTHVSTRRQTFSQDEPRQNLQRHGSFSSLSKRRASSLATMRPPSQCCGTRRARRARAASRLWSCDSRERCCTTPSPHRHEEQAAGACEVACDNRLGRDVELIELLRHYVHVRGGVGGRRWSRPAIYLVDDYDCGR